MSKEQVSVRGTTAEQRRGLVDRKLVEAPQLFYCLPSQGGPSVLVLWFFGEFRCGVLLFIDILVMYESRQETPQKLYMNMKIGKN